MAIKRNGITIGISGSDLDDFKEQQMNDFQEKRITWQGEDNVLVTTVLQRLYEFAAGKVQIILADTMPSSTEPNTQYWVKTYSGTTLEDGRFVIMTDTLNNATFIGKSSADLTEFYTKTEIDTKLADLTTSSFRDGVVLSTLGNSDNAKTLVSGQAARVALGNKQDKITASDQLTTPTDSDKLSYLNNVTNNRWTFSKIWDWIVTKLTGNTEKGIQVSGGKLGHTNNITVPTAKRILQATYDAQGHITAIENEFNWSNNYVNSAENQLFTRKGANDMYTKYLKSTNGKLTKSTAITNDYSHYVKCGNIYQLSIGFQNGSDIAKDALLYTLPESIASSTIEMYIVISTINGDSKILQTGGSVGNNQIKSKQVIPAGYWFGSAIFIKV
jgi:hypothetical protein